MRSRKAAIILGLMVALSLTTTLGAYAQSADPEGKPGPTPRAVRGVVLEKAARSFEIKKADGERLTVMVNTQTRFLLAGRPGVGFRGLQRGDRVTVLGRADKYGNVMARLVNIAPRGPRVLRLAGTVIDASKDSITVQTPKGASVTVAINDKTRFIPEDARPKKDDRVAVVGVQARGGKEIVARLVAVRKGVAPDKS